MNSLESLSPSQRAEVFRQIDHQIKMREAKPGQRQKSLVLGRFEINEDETNYEYPKLEELVPVVYEGVYYPESGAYYLHQARQSLNRFVRSLLIERRNAVDIAAEVRSQRESFQDLTDGEIIGVVTRNISFREFAVRTRLWEE